ncbi:MAG: phosphoribosylanthranilate isomerase [Dehalococcoidia bacterium]|nr:phosphoribosylanthranilate isomerase [Dehalococcoidia bacterium]
MGRERAAGGRMMTWVEPFAVKICGLSTEEAIEAAADADYVGFVFAPSSRRVTPARAAALARRLPVSGGPRRVGLFVNEDPTTIRAIVETVGLDLVQLCGDETPSDARALGAPVLRATRPVGEVVWDDLAEGTAIGRLVVDAHRPGAYGGTGALADWTLASAIAARWPVMLAGGLTPDNVAAAIHIVRPWAVDTSSGVETEGHKDPTKIRAFVAAARAAALVQERQ